MSSGVVTYMLPVETFATEIRICKGQLYHDILLPVYYSAATIIVWLHSLQAKTAPQDVHRVFSYKSFTLTGRARHQS